jgi:flagellar biosynthesis/type III secretory pathway chaperone
MQNATHSLASILTISIEKMQQLLQTLNQETELLKKNNIDELESITEKKTTITEQIEQNEQRRIHFLTSQSLNPENPEQWLNNNLLLTLWKKLKTVSTLAKTQNQINGLVINRNRNRIKSQIQILTTSSLPAADLVYSASGVSVPQRNSKTLARA